MEESAQNMEAKWEPECQGSGGIRKVELLPGGDSGDSWEGLWEVGGQTLWLLHGVAHICEAV